MGDGHVRRRRTTFDPTLPTPINVRTTTLTYDRLFEDSARAGVSLPRYLIECALREPEGGWSLRQQRWLAAQLDTVGTRLIRIGKNLNQMAAVTNATGEVPQGLATALEYFGATLDQLREVLGAIDPADTSRRSG